MRCAIARAGRVSVVLVCWLSSATVAHAIGTTWTAQRELVAPNASLNGVLADPAGDTITAVDTSSATETRTLAGGTWGDAQALSSVVQPTLAVGPNGDKVLVWQSENSLWVEGQNADRTGWDARQTITTLASGSQVAGLTVAVDASGTATIVWRSLIAGGGSSDWALESKTRYGPTHSLGKLQFIARGALGDGPALAADANGRATAVWLSGGQAYSASRVRPIADSPDPTWGAPAPAPLGPDASSSLDATAAPSGTGPSTYLFLTCSSGLEVAGVDSSGGWDTPQPIPGTATSPCPTRTQLTLGRDSAGDLTATWLQTDATDASAHHLMESGRLAGGAWSAPVDLSGATPADGDTAASVAEDNAGDVVATWISRTAGAEIVQARLRSAGSAFGDATVIGGNGSDNLGPPMAAIDGIGDIAVAWTDTNAATGQTDVRTATIQSASAANNQSNSGNPPPNPGPSSTTPKPAPGAPYTPPHTVCMPNLHGRGENAARAVLVRAGIATDSTHLSLVYRTGKRPPGVALGTVDSQTPAAGCGSQVATGAHGAARIALVLYDGPAGARLAQIAELATALRRQGADGDLQAVLGAVSAAHLIAILHLRPATVTHPIVVAVNGEKGAPRAVVLTVAMPRFASAYTDELFAGSASARIGARPLTAGRRTSLPVWVKSPVAGSHGLVARPGVSVLLDADAVGAGEVTRTTNARGEAVFSVAARRPGDLYVLATVPDGGGVRYAWGVITVKPTRRVP